MLYKRGKTYWIDFTAPDGQRIRRSAGTTEKSQAQELHDRLKGEAWRQIELGALPRVTWDDAGLRWLDERQDKASLNKDMSELAWLQTYFRGCFLDELTRSRIQEVLEIKRNETSPSTANRHLALIRAILNRCIEWGWLYHAPKLRQYPEPKKRIRWLRPEEAACLVTYLPAHLRDMAEFSLATGLRQANVTGLCWEQVDLIRHVAWVHPDEAKCRKPIGINLNATAMAIVLRQTGKHPVRVFTFRRKPVKQTNTHAWKKALLKADIHNFRWHDLRHTWASWHVQAGTPLERLQEMGGWESVEMVRRYAHLAPEHLAEDSARIDRVLSQLQGHGTNMAQPDKTTMVKTLVTT
ncbi:site-specific integrase [Acidithiobacillus thiooxidans]|uniref:Integrase n=1 Tax=Acidithiobacillus marinus TaxID=187490 RepID=A0A2I1DLH1_9PROT|nr:MULTISPECIES: site-specific integrase [Acidithiobacillus]MBU2839328.1 site-specific integrase [Acidithiobacillus thiooxidans]PKY10725.1 integrase [Acidithiobacillus marinus]